MIRKLLLIAILLLAAAGGPARAQDAIPWDALSENERKVLKPFEESWQDLPAQRQQRLRRGVERYSKMSPEEREKVQAASRS